METIMLSVLVVILFAAIFLLGVLLIDYSAKRNKEAMIEAAEIIAEAIREKK